MSFLQKYKSLFVDSCSVVSSVCLFCLFVCRSFITLDCVHYFVILDVDSRLLSFIVVADRELHG